MAKKVAAKESVAAPRQKPSTLVDMRPRCVQLTSVLKKTGSFYYPCDWHASHYVKVMRIFGENNFQNGINL